VGRKGGFTLQNFKGKRKNKGEELYGNSKSHLMGSSTARLGNGHKRREIKEGNRVTRPLYGSS